MPAVDYQSQQSRKRWGGMRSWPCFCEYRARSTFLHFHIRRWVKIGWAKQERNEGLRTGVRGYTLWYLVPTLIRGQNWSRPAQAERGRGRLREQRKTEKGSRVRWLPHSGTSRQVAEREESWSAISKKPQLLVSTEPNCVNSWAMWMLANIISPLTVSNKIVGSIFIVEAHFDWSIRIPVASRVYSQRWLIVSDGLKALLHSFILLCCSYFSLLVIVFLRLCLCSQLEFSIVLLQILSYYLTIRKKDVEMSFKLSIPLCIYLCFLSLQDFVSSL